MLADLYFNEFGDYTLFLIFGLGAVFGFVVPTDNMSSQKMSKVIGIISALISALLAFGAGEYKESGVGGWMHRLAGFGLLWVAFGIVLAAGVAVGSSFRQK